MDTVAEWLCAGLQTQFNASSNLVSISKLEKVMKYIYRGLTILIYDENTKQVKVPIDNDTKRPYFNQCKLIPEDYDLLEIFFTRCRLHTEDGTIFEDIEVN